MIRLASDFRKLARLSELKLDIQNRTKVIEYMQSIEQWEKNKHVIVATLKKIHNSSEHGCSRLYLHTNDPFLKTPEIHDFFLYSGFQIDGNSIDWSTDQPSNEIQ